MINVYIYDTLSNTMYVFRRHIDDPMPFSFGRSLKVADFCHNKSYTTVWTTTDTMQAYNQTKRKFPNQINVVQAFRHCEDGFDLTKIGLNLGTGICLKHNSQILELQDFDEWESVEIDEHIYVDSQMNCLIHKQLSKLKENEPSLYVLLIQDMLNYLGYGQQYYSGYLDQATIRMLSQFQMDVLGTCEEGISERTWFHLVGCVHTRQAQ